MAQEISIENPSASKDAATSGTTESEKLKARKDRNKPPTKVVMRLLPPSMTKEIFLQEVSPIPEYDYLYFVRADLELGQAAYSRAYINFLNYEDIFTFSDQYDGYIFVDKSGTEYPASVEIAPFQRVPKKKTIPRKDSKAGTIEEDPTYIAFLESLAEELEEKENEHTFDYSYKPPDNDAKKVTTTPLLEFLKQRRLDRQRSRDERKEDRRKKEIKEMERRKARDDEKKKKKLEFKEKEVSTGTISKSLARNPDKDIATASSSKDHENKPTEKKFEDKPSFKDRKFQEGRNRDKLAPKQASSRQKTFESRPNRDVRRSNEDLQKKPVRTGDEKSEQAPKKPPVEGKKKYPEKDSGYAKPNRKDERYGDRKFDKDRDQPRKDVERRHDDKPIRDQQRKEKDDRHADKKVEESRPLKDRKYSDNRPRDKRNAERKASETKHPDEPRERPGGKGEPKKTEPLPGSDGDKGRRGSAGDEKGRSQAEPAEPKSFQKSAESLGRSHEKTTAKTRRSSLDSSKPEASSSGGKEVRRIHSLELDGPGPSPPPSEGAGSRAERRIRNKDRPSIEIYRPGMGRIAKQRTKD